MVQASSWRQQVLNRIQGSSQKQFQSRFLKQLSARRFQGPGGWLLAATVVVAMLLWNWKLLLATSAGVFVMLLVYLMQEWDWQVHWSSLRRLLSGSNRQLTLAVGSGGIAATSTYLAVSVWVESESSWIAAGAILQGLGTLATLILLVWLIITRQENREQANLDQLFTDLTQVDPLKRLIAVRSLSDLVTDAHLDAQERRKIVEYFRLMLSREQETLIRDAVLDGLQALENSQLLIKGGQPLQTPVVLKRPTAKIRRKA